MVYVDIVEEGWNHSDYGATQVRLVTNATKCAC
jgi:hypothetical protein